MVDDVIKGEITQATSGQEDGAVNSVDTAVAQVRPWVRFWARMLDINFFGMFFSVVELFLFPQVVRTPAGLLLLGIANLFIWVFVESLYLVGFGATPGKWWFRIHIILPSGSAFTFSKAFSRSIKVWLRGLGMGIPFVNLITLSVASNRLLDNKITSWDKEAGIVIKHERIGALRVIAAIAFFTLLVWLDLADLPNYK